MHILIYSISKISTFTFSFCISLKQMNMFNNGSSFCRNICGTIIIHDVLLLNKQHGLLLGCQLLLWKGLFCQYCSALFKLPLNVSLYLPVVVVSLHWIETVKPSCSKESSSSLLVYFQTSNQHLFPLQYVTHSEILNIHVYFYISHLRRQLETPRKFRRIIYRLQYNESQQEISCRRSFGAVKLIPIFLTANGHQFGKCPNSVKLSQQRKCSNCGISNVISEMPIRKSHLILQHLSCKKCIRQDKWTDRQIDVQ
ncbi:hypothetical protein T02_13857 [Trichinella nativa]|uniref:Uncharacterized protein n=1 Tax=Trichinella nativa TaxID=6335 RepID=A0A0V1LNV2_9BILA|nr:hypothetical protein T02_13857 [Trichinella nativa]